MDECDLNNANETDNTQQELKETEPIEKLEHDIEQDICKSPVIKTNPGNETINIILKEKDGQESGQKDDELQKDNNIQKKVSVIIDSDSEDEILFAAKSKRKKAIYDNSEDEESDSNQNESENHLDNKENAKTDLDSDSNNASNTADGNDNEQRSRFKALIDTDSEIEEEEEDGKHSTPIRNKKIGKHKDGKDSKSNMRKVSLRASKEEAMKQIRNETQRLIRETEVSVPYHKPKQQSLQAFLNRKRIITALPKAPTMATKLKLSSAIVEEVLKEKEKEAEIFYKSSDSEEETIEDHSSDKENLDCQQQVKYPSRKLFTDNNSPANDNKEQSTTNEVQEPQGVQETSTEMKESEDIEAITDSEAKDANDSMTVEVHCDFNDAKNIDEVSRNDGVKSSETSENVVVNDTLLSKDIAEVAENENQAESTHDDSEKCNKESPDKSPDCSARKMNNDYAKLVKESLGLNASEVDEYNEYGLPPPTFDDSPNINEKKSLLKLKSFKPKLRGTPGTVIDLSGSSKPDKNGINCLIDRFVNKHSKVNECKKDTSSVTATRIIESPNGISVVKETLPYKAPALANEDPRLKKPGAKLVRLREELKHKMALKRDEEWKQREQEMKEEEIEWDESMTEEEEEEHLSDSPSPSIEPRESDQDELEEDDVCMRSGTRKKKKNAYIDDEADVTDEEINDSDEIEDELSEHLEDEKDNEDCDNNEESSKRKTFKRIFEPLEDDSRSSNTELIENIIDKQIKGSISRKTESDIFDTPEGENEQDNENESDIQASQEHVESDLKCQTPQIKTNRFDFVSPVTQLTALNVHFESEEEEEEEEEQSPEIKKQLPILMGFTQSQELTDHSNPIDDESNREKLNFHLSRESNVTESQLLDLCSGKFTSQASDPRFSVDISESVQISSEQDSLSTKEDVNDEKKQSEKDTTGWNGLRVVSSDEEDLMEDNVKERARKRVKKLDLSDDENEQSSDDENDEEKYIDYDSEENEVVVSSKNMKQYASKFLEEEAELSESDCDVSADENEEDLDKLEFEEVDDEEIDESKVKKQLEKLHVKQLLDEDQKEVRMLKELLFEEGDLYSESARERKFKWRNIDKQENGDDVPMSDDKDGWVDLSDDEEEAKWRKLKHEREKFLTEKLGNIDAEIEEDLNKSQIFNLGMKILKKRRINETNKEETLLESLDSKVELRIPHTVAEMLNSTKLEGNSRMINSALKKRSFLAKGEESLARLATLARQKDTALPSLKAKNFVFAHIDDSPEEKESAPVIKIQPKLLKAKRNR